MLTPWRRSRQRWWKKVAQLWSHRAKHGDPETCRLIPGAI